MTSDALVKINLDPPEKIADLYRIGPATARRIVEARANNRYFHTPEDLGQIEGVGIQLAHLLSPQIDWQIPETAVPQEPRKLSALVQIIIFNFLVMIFLGYLVYKHGADIAFLSSIRRFNDPDLFWTYMTMNVSLLFVYIFMLIGTVMFFIAPFIALESKVRKLRRHGITFYVVGLLFVIPLGIANLVYYSWFANEGFIALFKNPLAMLGLIAAISGYLEYSPIIYLYLSKGKYPTKAFFVISDVGFSLSTILIASSVWFFRYEFPIGILAIALIEGVYAALLSFNALRYRFSLSKVRFDYWFSYLLDASSESKNWVTWLNIHLPDHEQQRELKEALDKAYPTSIKRTFLNIVVIGAGGWIIVTALSAIVQWLIEKFLNNIWPGL